MGKQDTVHISEPLSDSKTKKIKNFFNQSSKKRNLTLYLSVFALVGVVSLLVSFAATAPNLALSKPVSASSLESATMSATNMADGNASTRWASASGVDPQWVLIDLGNTYNVNRVVLNWEVAAAKDYVVQVASTPTGPWSTIKTVTGNTSAGIKDYTSLTGSGRYVRVYMTSRVTQWGYSLYEAEVYGASPTVATATNVALSKTTSSSSNESSSYLPGNAVDGNASTRWASATGDNQWYMIDLGSSYNLTRVVLNWEYSAGRDYDIQASASSAGPWTTLKSVTGNTTDGIKDYTGLSGTGRYMRLNLKTRKSQWGFSLYEVEVYAATGGINYVVDPPVTVFPEFKGEYFNNNTLTGSPVVIRNDASINYAWGNGSPDSLLPADSFSARWTRNVSFAAGNQRFTATADDGVRVYVDGKIIIDKWFGQPPTTYTADVALTAGSHAVKMEYNETGGGATAILSYAAATVVTVCPAGTTGTYPNCVTNPVTPTGVGGAGADMTPGRKCAGTVPNPRTITGGDLNSAIANTPNGATLIVDGGSYGNVNISGRSNLIICGKPGTRPKVNPSGGNGFLISDSTYIHIEGFEVGGSATGLESGIRVSSNSHHIAAWDNWVHDLGSLGIGAANGYCGHVDFRYNRVWNTAYYDGYHSSGMSVYEPRNCGGGADVGIYSDFVIGNVVFNNGEKIGGATDGNCIIWDDTLDVQKGNQSEGPYTGRVLLANNVCVSNGGRGVHIGPTSAHADVVNNTNYHNFNPAFTVPDAYDGLVGETDGGYQSNDVRFVNNVAIARSGKNGFDAADGSNLAASNNLFYPVSRDGGLSAGFRQVTDAGFVNPTEVFTQGDFRPRSGSPMINAGIGSYSNMIIPRVDVLGKARSATNPSIGAYEP